MAVSQKTLSLIRSRSEKQIKKKMKKPPIWFHPNAIEIEYRRVLYNLTRQLRKLIRENLLPRIPGMIVEVNSLTPEPSRGDDWRDELQGIILTISEAILPTVEQTITAMERIGLQISNYNHGQFNKINNSVFGVDIFINQPWLADQLELFASQNSQLIKSLPSQELLQVAGIVERRLQEGRTTVVVEQDLIKRFGITRRRAKLIARDQTTKLNASLTKLRQQELGVEEYVWQTAEDERVRSTHRANNGKKFKWDNPPAITGHPGTDINCRCVALPVLEGVID